jgi:hypothetical protein
MENIERRSHGGIRIFGCHVMDTDWYPMSNPLFSLFCCNAFLFYSSGLHGT